MRRTLYKGKFREPREGQWGGVEKPGGITWGEMPDVRERGTEAANHTGMCVPIIILHDLHMYPRT